MFNRAKGALARCLCYRALELAREHNGPETCPDCKGAGGKRTRDGKLRCWTCQGNGILAPYPGPAPDLRRHPSSHSSGPPHVGTGTAPPGPLACACGCGRTGCGWCGSDSCRGCGPL